MRNDEYLRLGYGIGSGAVESAHKQVIHARLRTGRDALERGWCTPPAGVATVSKSNPCSTRPSRIRLAWKVLWNRRLRMKGGGANYFFCSSFFIGIPVFFDMSIEAGIMAM